MEPYGWAQLVRRGATRAEVEAQLRAGTLERVRRGVYAPAAELSPAERHLRLVTATMESLVPGSVVSHFSAALLHGLPAPAGRLDRVWVTRDGVRANGRVKGCLRFQHAPLDASEIVVRDGVAVTSLARTAVDVACRVDFRSGVAVVDAAMARGVLRSELDAAVARARGVTGIGRARRVVAFADPRSESVGESWSRALMLEHGVPIPDLQHELYDDGGLIGRVDFWWKERRLVGEFDGKIKYTRELSDEDPSQVVPREKQREDRIRRRQCGVERWIWADFRRPQRWAARLHAALR